MNKKRTRTTMQWHRIDLHLHSPASSDYQQPEASFLEMLQRAEARNLAIIAFTDHNTIAGYRKMRAEIEQLELLEKLNRLLPEERNRLNEYRRLTQKILVLPGFEFTATFGFHILGIFSPNKPIREIEHLLLKLNVPADQLDDGSATIGASSDVLTAYRAIHEAGGIVIAAHANSSNGVAMRGFNFGGQTKIAYTQDEHLHALEVTDFDQKGARTTAAFFNGTKPEYPRRMHCIQGSDAHRITADPQRKKNLGIGDRPTEVLLPEISFEALKELFSGNDFARTRPAHPQAEPAYDFIQIARDQGANIIQDFHESMTVRGGKLYNIIADVCAFANTNGGTLYIGLNADSKKPPIGISNPEYSIAQLEKEISTRISPPLTCTLDIQETQNKKIIRILVPRGDDPPYAVDDNKIYVRDEAETGLAVRDEIVGLVLRGERAAQKAALHPENLPASVSEAVPTPLDSPAPETTNAPRTGVEIVEVTTRDGQPCYTVRDLRNGNVVKNVTARSARRLWHYAITAHAKLPADLNKASIQWRGEIGILRRYKQGIQERYDLAQRAPNGSIRLYFGVTDDGIEGEWKTLLGSDEP